MIHIEEKHLKDIIIGAVKIGLLKGSMQKSTVKPFISKREAFRLYGERAVQRWINEGLITEIKDGEGNSKIRIDRIQIEIVASTSNRGS